MTNVEVQPIQDKLKAAGVELDDMVIKDNDFAFTGGNSTISRLPVLVPFSLSIWLVSTDS